MSKNVFYGAKAFMLAGLLSAHAEADTLSAVNLRSTAKFAVLAGSLVSNIPPSAITGDIGLSPAAGSSITGFGLTEVTGTIFTVGPPGPAGSVVAATELTAAQGDLTLAYNDAAGRAPAPVGAYLNPGSGNIGGMTLTSGLYKFTGGAAITGSDLVLTGSATDVWIFQIASDLNVGDGIKVTLQGEAVAANVFWQVGTSAVLGTTSAFKGTIIADQSITLNGGATLLGRALARIAAVTLSANAVTVPPPAITTGIASKAFGGLKEGTSLSHKPGAIEFTLPASGNTVLRLMNTAGKEVATLYKGEVTANKSNRVSINPDQVTKGLYFSSLEFNGEVRMTKLVVIN